MPTPLKFSTKNLVKHLAICAGALAMATGAQSVQADGFAAQNYKENLTDVCPNPLIVQKDWLAEAEHGGFYQLIGANGEMKSGQYSGPLGATGIDLVILEGGGGIGLGDGETAYSSLFYGNSKAGVTPHLGFQELDNAFIFSKTLPTVSVFAPLDRAPQGLFWDRATYPKGFHSIDDLKEFAKSNLGKIYVSSIRRTWGLYLVQSGVDPEAFIEGYRGDGENFVANNGTWLNQGFATSEPYAYANGKKWNKPVDFVTTDVLGYPNYTGTLAVAKHRLEELAPCLEKFVPMLQQAWVDYAKDPREVNALITAFNDAGHGTSWWKTEPGKMDYAHKTMLDLGVIGNGSNDTLGDFDMARVNIIHSIVKGWFDERSQPDIKPEDVITNRFIDPTIGLKK